MGNTWREPWATAPAVVRHSKRRPRFDGDDLTVVPVGPTGDLHLLGGGGADLHRARRGGHHAQHAIAPRYEAEMASA
jgi:hypothetical protein